MKLALLGCTPQTLALVEVAVRLGHEVVAAFDADRERTQLREAVPGIRIRDDWESLLAARDVDGVVVAGPRLPEDTASDVQERRDDQLRKLIQNDVPLLVIPPVCEAIVGFELEMIRKDVRGIIVPALGAPLHPAWDDLEPWLSRMSATAGGTVELVTFERLLTSRQRAEVLTAFAADAEIMRRIVGPLRRITASGGGSGEGGKRSLSGLAVQVEGEAPFPIRWSVAPPADSAGGRLTAVAGTERMMLLMPEGREAWKLRGGGLDRDYESFCPLSAALNELENAIAFRSLPSVTWLDACRGTEAMEAIDRSLQRARSIDLHNEEHSEESSFKGVMAAGGCMLLLATVVALVCSGIIPALVPPAERSGSTYWAWAQVCFLVPLALFLGAQLLSFGLAHHLRAKGKQTSDGNDKAKLND